MTFLLRPSAAALVFVSLSGITTPASADPTVDQCVDANTRAQSLERDGKLAAAREQLKLCVAFSCPGLVRDDCTRRLDDLERSQPTIVFDARDADGNDVVDVRVHIDGHPFAERLDGIAVATDPGEHTFTFEKLGRPPVTHHFVLREGQKGRHERIVFTSLVRDRAGDVNVLRSPEAAPPHGLGPQRVVAVASLGVGLVGLAAGVALAVNAKAKRDDSNAICPSDGCANGAALEMNRDARTAGDIATFALVAGTAAVGASVVLWLSAKPGPASPSVQLGWVGNAVQVKGAW